MILLKFDKAPLPEGGGALANFSSEERPGFIDALIATILYNPFSVKCS